MRTWHSECSSRCPSCSGRAEPPGPVPRLREPAPGRLKPHQVLAEALVSGRVSVQRVAELLQVQGKDVPAIASGRVTLGATSWCRLLRELELC